MIRSRRFFSVLGVLVGLLVTGLLGCDNTVDPFGNRADTYAIYGYLAENRQKQFIRVKRLDVPLSKQDAPLDVTVRLENLTDGQSEILKDSLIYFEEKGSTIGTHNFWTDTPIQPETRYRLSVEHPDGETTEATTVTPPSVKAVALPDSGSCDSTFTVDFPSVRESHRVRSTVAFQDNGSSGTDGSFHHAKLDNFQTRGDGRVSVDFQLQNLFRTRFDNLECDDVEEGDIDIYYTYLGPDWHTDLPIDSLDLSPVQSPYVDNGKGFFGALWRDTVSVYFDPSSGPDVPGPASRSSTE